MVYLNRIYTRTGDDGQTGLGDGTRIAKTHPRIKAYGGVDELNSVLGLAIAHGVPEPFAGWMKHIQNDLFDVGSDLCFPETEEPKETPELRVVASQIEQLEQWIDAANEPLEALTSFVLPGGSLASSALHQTRAVCRRVEIDVLQLAEFEVINPQVTMYLNRLSDLLFVLARACNNNGKDDVLWIPGKNR